MPIYSGVSPGKALMTITEILTILVPLIIAAGAGVVFIERRLSTIETNIKWIKRNCIQCQPPSGKPIK